MTLQPDRSHILPPNLNGSLLVPEFSFLRDVNQPGGWKVRDDVWIVFNESGAPPDDQYWHGGLSVGYGGVHLGPNAKGQTNATEVGPELGFGWALGDSAAASDRCS